MKRKLSQKITQNRIIAIAFTLLVFVVVGVLFDFYYDLNDDVSMKNILSGAYTGTPEGHNIQMLYPISWLISVFYSMTKFYTSPVPVYSFFLLGCQVVAIYCITERMLLYFRKIYGKALALLVEFLMIFSLYLYELVFLQYTVTCTMLAAAAVMCFITTEKHATMAYVDRTGKDAQSILNIELCTKDYIVKNLPCIILVILAFQIRSEMLLLVFPFICVVGFYKWMAEKPIFTKRNVTKYLSVFGAIILGLLLSEGVHRLAYSSPEWQKFNALFDARTELYDFQYIPSYEGNEAFYESVGITENEQKLLENYNYGFDEKIDEALMNKIAEYAATQKAENTSFQVTMKKALFIYKYRTLYATDIPFNHLVILLYALVLVCALLNKHFRMLWQLLLLGFVRSGLWLYIVYNGRDPIRITHSLYLIEIVILVAFLLGEITDRSRLRKPDMPNINLSLVMCVTSILCIGLYSYFALGDTYSKVKNEYVRREEVNKDMTALLSYAREHQENFYFWDVYSSVDYSEKLFKDVDNTYENFDICGGWVCKSPLMQKKYSKYEITSMKDALLLNHQVFFFTYSDEKDNTRNPFWLTDFYADFGIHVKIEEVDTIFVDGQSTFTIYKLSE